ncbi:MAG: hypothetical protein JST74_02750 [Bacteroidetes bacterium]|nr:hypothetical protein [Bacteroidota bacterium]
MEIRDVIVTPVVILAVLFVAYFIRPRVTDDLTRKYFLPALVLKIFGAIALGFIYQFYYSGGDTFNYHTHGSRHMWEAIIESPSKGLSFFFREASDYQGVYKYASRILFFNDPNSLVVVKFAALLDLFTFSTYSATATLFAVFSFIGAWCLFITFYRQYPKLYYQLAIATLFIPSVIFWGSGILKDSIVLSCLGIATFQFYKFFTERRLSIINLMVLLISLYLIFSIKKFILQAYLPAVILWIVAKNISRVPSLVARMMIVPFMAGLIAYSAYYSVIKVGEGDSKYSVDKLAETVKVTAYDIRYWSGREAGSGYSLGELDGSFGSMVKLAPQAINVSLFRPYLWEVKNPLMLLSALEATFFLFFTLYVLAKKRLRFFQALADPNIIFAYTFSLSFAFAVGVSTFNFGTLARYKIPLLPFFATALILTYNHLNNERKLIEFDLTE